MLIGIDIGVMLHHQPFRVDHEGLSFGVVNRAERGQHFVRLGGLLVAAAEGAKAAVAINKALQQEQLHEP